eukprot:SAG11_NODE_396_length_9806_cov_37.601855_1_plen_58_part_00
MPGVRQTRLSGTLLSGMVQSLTVQVLFGPLVTTDVPLYSGVALCSCFADYGRGAQQQ